MQRLKCWNVGKEIKKFKYFEHTNEYVSEDNSNQGENYSQNFVSKPFFYIRTKMSSI